MQNRQAEDRVDEVVDPVENVLSEAVQAERRAHNLMNCDSNSGPISLGHPRGPTGSPSPERQIGRKRERENPPAPFIGSLAVALDHRPLELPMPCVCVCFCMYR